MPSPDLSHLSPAKQAQVKRFLLPHRLTPERARLLRPKADEARRRKNQDRKAKHDKAWSRLTTARVADTERRLLIAEQRIDQLTQVLKRAKLLKSAKPRPAVGDDIPTLANPPTSPAQSGPEPR